MACAGKYCSALSKKTSRVWAGARLLPLHPATATIAGPLDPLQLNTSSELNRLNAPSYLIS